MRAPLAVNSKWGNRGRAQRGRGLVSPAGLGWLGVWADGPHPPCAALPAQGGAHKENKIKKQVWDPTLHCPPSQSVLGGGQVQVVALQALVAQVGSCSAAGKARRSVCEGVMHGVGTTHTRYNCTRAICADLIPPDLPSKRSTPSRVLALSSVPGRRCR